MGHVGKQADSGVQLSNIPLFQGLVYSETEHTDAIRIPGRVRSGILTTYDRAVAGGFILGFLLIGAVIA